MGLPHFPHQSSSPKDVKGIVSKIVSVLIHDKRCVLDGLPELQYVMFWRAGSCIQWGGRLNQGRREWSSWNPGDARGCLFFWKRLLLGKPRCGGSMCQRSPPHRWAPPPQSDSWNRLWKKLLKVLRGAEVLNKVNQVYMWSGFEVSVICQYN